MKSDTGGIQAHLDLNVTTLAWCWKATRRDGAIFGFTSHDQNLTIDGIIYYAETGLNATNAQAKVGTSVDNLEVGGMLDSNTITEEDLRSGLWDGCEIKVFIVNWKNTVQQLTIQVGTLGDVTIKKLQFTAEMRSLAQFLQNTIGRIITKRCDADFGDTRCGINIATYTLTDSVGIVLSDSSFISNTTLSLNPFGKLTWTSGLNSGSSMEVKSIATNNITLVLPMANSIQIGDTFSIHSGCDKNFTSTTGCSSYSNQINFRGFPFIPGVDAIMLYPNAH